jgi:hypothetical protein
MFWRIRLRCRLRLARHTTADCTAVYHRLDQSRAYQRGVEFRKCLWISLNVYACLIHSSVAEPSRWKSLAHAALVSSGQQCFVVAASAFP